MGKVRRGVVDDAEPGDISFEVGDVPERTLCMMEKRPTAARIDHENRAAFAIG